MPPSPSRAPLPVDQVLPQVLQALRTHRSLVLEAPPGAGKTTRVPPALLGLLGPDGGQVLVLQPRRLAARLMAARVAQEAGEALGQGVGYRVRFDERGGPATRLWFLTEGVLLRRLLTDPGLRGVGAVVLDEFHERGLDADLALALLKRAQDTTRPDLGLVVMSATLDAAPVAAYLGDAARVRAEGRAFPVALEHAQRTDVRPLAIRVAEALRQVLSQDAGAGDVLVFLPGAAEIRQAGRACAEVVERSGRLLLPLHGDLSPEEQDRAVRPSEQRRVILSTNVAETSITLEGVTCVIDSGLARRAFPSRWAGLRALGVLPVSRASADQRAGRAGRTQPGRCLRLYTRADYEGRPEHDAPEVARADLADALLTLAGMGLQAEGDGANSLRWLEAPPARALEAAHALLERLGALDAAGRVTGAGREMLGLATHPRLAQVVRQAAARGRLEAGCRLAAWLEEGARGARGGAALEWGGEAPRPRQGWECPDPLEALEGDRRDSPQVERASRQLLAQARRAGLRDVPAAGEERGALAQALLAGFPDRVGCVVRRAGDAGTRADALEALTAGGGAVSLPGDSHWQVGQWLVVTDAEERRGMGTPEVRARAATPIDPDWLLELFTERVEDLERLEWDPRRERVVALRRLVYDGLALEESTQRNPDPARAAEVLWAQASRLGLEAFARPEEDLAGFLGRLDFLRRHAPQLEVPQVDQAACAQALREACQGRRSFAELREAGVLGALRARLPAPLARALERLAPERLTLPGGRTLRLTYRPGQPPEAASRLQDFFGMRAGPSVLDGRVPITLHLLAPNGRDVQVTSDLAGFWARHYPGVARELRRRYPRHPWPDDPLTARPPGPGRTRT